MALDTKRIVTEMASRHGVRMDEDDPALNIVALNRLMLEQSADQIIGRIHESIQEFESAVAKVQTRAGQLVAAEFNDRLASIRNELQNDITLAGAKATEIVYRVERANRQPVMFRWASLGFASALLLFLAGLWIGAHYLG